MYQGMDNLLDLPFEDVYTAEFNTLQRNLEIKMPAAKVNVDDLNKSIKDNKIIRLIHAL